MVPASVAFTAVSSNSKTGPIPVTTSSRETCPTTCPFFDAGCYAKGGHTGLHWRKVTEGKRGGTWQALLESVKRIPRGQVWRHNVAGDLPHDGGTIDRAAVLELAAANRGRRGFTYSHHVLTDENRGTIAAANAAGFTVNASCESVAEADRVAATGIPAVAVVPSTEARKSWRTDSGRVVVVCPATTQEGMTCSRCQLCARGDRSAIVAFPAHGSQSRKVDAIVAGVA